MKLYRFILTSFLITLFIASSIRVSSAGTSDKNDSNFTLSPKTIENEKTWGLDAIEAIEAWGLTMGSPDITVAVIDTGVDINHEDLSNSIWTNPGEIPDNGIDDDQNGYIDDIHGWNFVANSTQISDDFGHGTHVSGTITAELNDVGVVGVAPNVKIMVLKVFDLSAEQFATNENIAEAIIYASDQGAKVISMSLGGPAPTFVVYDAIDYAVSKDVLIVAASGNDGLGIFQFPSGNPEVIAVGSINENLELSDFSNYGSQQELVAPGEFVRSTLPNNTYGSYSGTSMATPHVAGVAALVYSLNSSLTRNEVRTILDRTTVDLGDPGRDDQYGLGLVNAKLATQTTIDKEGPDVQFIDAVFINGNELNITITSQDGVGLFSTGYYYTDPNGETVLIENNILTKEKFQTTVIILELDKISADSVITFFTSDLKSNFGGFAFPLSSIIDFANGVESTTSSSLSSSNSSSSETSKKKTDFSTPYLILFSVALIPILVKVRRVFTK